jgi:hypothetical protein
MITHELPVKPPATAGGSDKKAKAPTSPKVDAITLQSQFSQGESMNEEILKSSRLSRVAETLQSTCEDLSCFGARDFIKRKL